MPQPDQLSTYARTLRRCTVLLPRCRNFPTVAVLGVRDNGAGRPTGIEANFIRFVATSLERFTSETTQFLEQFSNETTATDWPQEPFQADGVDYEGERIVVRKGGDEYRIYIDRHCPITLHSVTALPNEFPSLIDPDALELYLQEHQHTTTPLASAMHVPQMQAQRERPVQSPQLSHKKEKPLYDGPSKTKSLAWLIVGIVFVIVGLKVLTLGATRGVVVNFYAWAAIVVGAVLIVRRGLDLVFPPSRL